MKEISGLRPMLACIPIFNHFQEFTIIFGRLIDSRKIFLNIVKLFWHLYVSHQVLFLLQWGFFLFLGIVFQITFMKILSESPKISNAVLKSSNMGCAIFKVRGTVTNNYRHWYVIMTFMKIVSQNDKITCFLFSILHIYYKNT